MDYVRRDLAVDDIDASSIAPTPWGRVGRHLTDMPPNLRLFLCQMEAVVERGIVSYDLSPLFDLLQSPAEPMPGFVTFVVSPELSVPLEQLTTLVESAIKHKHTSTILVLGLESTSAEDLSGLANSIGAGDARLSEALAGAALAGRPVNATAIVLLTSQGPRSFLQLKLRSSRLEEPTVNTLEQIWPGDRILLFDAGEFTFAALSCSDLFLTHAESGRRAIDLLDYSHVRYHRQEGRTRLDVLINNELNPKPDHEAFWSALRRLYDDEAPAPRVVTVQVNGVIRQEGSVRVGGASRVLLHGSQAQIPLSDRHIEAPANVTGHQVGAEPVILRVDIDDAGARIRGGPQRTVRAAQLPRNGVPATLKPRRWTPPTERSDLSSIVEQESRAGRYDRAANWIEYGLDGLRPQVLGRAQTSREELLSIHLTYQRSLVDRFGGNYPDALRHAYQALQDLLGLPESPQTEALRVLVDSNRVLLEHWRLSQDPFQAISALDALIGDGDRVPVLPRGEGTVLTQWEFDAGRRDARRHRAALRVVVGQFDAAQNELSTLSEEHSWTSPISAGFVICLRSDIKRVLRWERLPTLAEDLAIIASATPMRYVEQYRSVVDYATMRGHAQLRARALRGLALALDAQALALLIRVRLGAMDIEQARVGIRKEGDEILNELEEIVAECNSRDAGVTCALLRAASHIDSEEFDEARAILDLLGASGRADRAVNAYAVMLRADIIRLQGGLTDDVLTLYRSAREESRIVGDYIGRLRATIAIDAIAGQKRTNYVQMNSCEMGGWIVWMAPFGTFP